MRDPYGFGELNDAGRELLCFLSSHQGMVGNSWFQKKGIYKQTWRHLKSGDWHCIDYVLMQQKHRSSCLDVSVKRGAVCDTDHNLVCLKLRIRKPYKRKQCCVLKGRRFDATKLRTSVPGDSDDGEPLKLTFVTQVLEKAHAVWPVENDVDGQWSALRGALLESAENVLGYERSYQPDWFREAFGTLHPLLQRRNWLYTAWLATSKEEDHMRLRQAREEARREIRKEKNAWFAAKAADIEHGSFGGVEVWRGIRDLQHGRRGLIPSRAVTITDENGDPCCHPASQQARWRRHFTSVFNLCGSFSAHELDLLEQRPVRIDIAAVPSALDIAATLAKVKNRKAPGSSGILLEMVKAGTDNFEFCDLIADLVGSVWKEERVPQEWVDAILIPVPKKEIYGAVITGEEFLYWKWLARL